MAVNSGYKAVASFSDAIQKYKNFGESFAESDHRDHALSFDASALGTSAGMGTLRALEPRVLLDAAVLVTVADTIADQVQQDAQMWRDSQESIAPPASDSNNDSGGEIAELFASEELQSQNQSVELAFVDASLDDLQTILDGLDDNVEVILIDPNSDGVEQIAAALSTRQNVDAIHIISHGRSGVLELGDAQLTQASISGEHADEMAVIRSALSENADILLYGCDFGENETGISALNVLAAATGADIAASNDITGSQKLGGDWDLEVQTGQIEAIALSPRAWAGTLDLTINNVGTVGATALAQEILGTGVTINSASYSGGAAQAGTFSTGAGVSFGSNVISFTEGAIFSSGTAVSVAGSNSTGSFSVDAPGIDNDPDFNGLAGGSTFDASFIEISFTPDVPPGASVGDTARMTMEIVFGSDEYNEFVYGSVNDTLAVIVNGVNQADVPNGLAIGIDTINAAATFNPAFGSPTLDPNPEHVSAGFESANPSLYINNDTGAFNTQLDGFTVTIPVTFDVIVGQVNTIKLGISDTGDAAYDSWMFVKADSGQTVIVAENDTVNTPTDVPVTIDVTANDYDLQGDTLSVTHILDQAVTAGDVITLASGVTVTVGAGGNLTVAGDGTNTANDTFTYEITDGNGGTSTAFVSVIMTAANSAPVIDLNDNGGTANRDFAATYTEGSAAVLVTDTDADAIDVDDNISSLQIAVLGNVDGAEDVITIGGLIVPLNTSPNFTNVSVGGSSVDITYNSGSGIFTVTNSTGSSNPIPQADLDILIRGITYQNQSENPTASNRTLSFTVTDTGGATSAAAVSTISVVAVNDLSVLDLDGNDSAGVGSGGFQNTFTEDGGAVAVVDSDVSLTDIDDIAMSQILVNFSGLADGASEVLTIGGTSFPLNTSVINQPVTVGGTTFEITYSTGTGNFSITRQGGGDAPIADVEAILASITYDNSSQDPTAGNRTVSISVNDGDDNSNTAVSTITVVPVNDAPQGADSTLTTNEDTAHTFSASDFGFSDPSDGNALQSVTIQPLTGSGTLTLNGVPVTSATVIPAANIGLLVYTPPANANGAGLASLQFQVTDDGGTANSGQDTDQTPNTLTLDITSVPDLPGINLDPNNDNGTPGDGTDDGFDDAGFEVTFTENDPAVAIVDTDLSVIDPEDDIVEMTVTLTNGQIGDTINFPSSLPGNITAAVSPASTLAAAGVMTITFTGDNTSTNADWAAVLQALTFAPSTNDIHNPNPADRDIEIQLSDATMGFSPTVTATVHVVPENDPPTLDLDDDNSSGINAGNYQGTYVENATGLAISDLAIITDLDDSNLESVTISLTNGEIGDLLEIGTLPAGVSLVGVAPSNLTSAGTQTITLTGSASLADYQLAIAAVTFSNDSDDPAAGIRNITVVGNDGDDDTPVRTAFVTVSPVNDPPAPVNPLTPGVPPVDPNAVIPGQSAQDGAAVTPINTAQYFADPDDTVLTYSLAPGAPTWAVINPTTGELTGTPPANASQNTNNGTAGSYDIVIVATDPSSLTGQTTVVFTVTNPAPVAEDDTLTVAEDAANLTGSVFSANGTATGDTDPDGDTIVVAQVDGAGANVATPTAGSNGGLFTINANGTFVFDQNGEFDSLAVGESQITTIAYQISDGEGGTDTATITLTVTGTNDTPTAVNDTTTTGEDAAISITAAAGLIVPNDTDPDASDTLVVSAVNGTGPVGTQITLPSGALLTVNTDGSYDYDPNGSFESLAVGETGTDTFAYTVSDGNGGTDTATVTITINGVNDAPTANADTGTTDENNSVSVPVATGLIDTNDTDPDASDTLVVSAVNGTGPVGTQITLPSGALLTVNADGSYDYDPNGQFNTLAAGETATDTFAYTLSDGNGGSDTATVTLTINGVNDAPTAVNDTTTTGEDTAFSITAAAGLIDPNDTDPDASDILVVSAVNGTGPVGTQITLPSGALLTVNADGSYDYDPNGSYNALAAGETSTDTFTYTVSDGNGGTDTATVTININGANDAPTANNDTGTSDEETAISVPAATGLIDSNDIDPDASDILVVSAVNGTGPVGTQITLPSGALLTVNADGSYDYDPNGSYNALAAGESATDTFAYTISDGNGGSDTATVTLTINGVNDAPTAVNDTTTTGEDSAISITAAAGLIDPNDTDPDASDVLVVSAVNGTGPVGTQITLPSGALLTVNADGSYDYDPNGSYNALAAGETSTDTFTYTVSDGNGGSDTATVTININGANDAPTANADTGTTDEDNAITVPAATGLIDSNDTDPDASDILVVSAVNGTGPVGSQITLPSGALLTVNADGSYVYDPNGQFNSLAVGATGTDTFTYTIIDGNGGTDTASVTMTITGVNDAPEIIDPLNPLIPPVDPNNIIPDVSYTDGQATTPINAGTFFNDPDSDQLSFTATDLPPGLTINPTTGAITGTLDPDASKGGSDPVGAPGVYQVVITGTDIHGASVTTTVDYTVTNIPPTAVDDTAVTDESTTASGNVISGPGTDTDGAPDSDPLVVSEINGQDANVGQPVTGSSGGTFIINSDGSWTFDPGNDFNGLGQGESRDTSVTYQVSDGNGGFDQATLTLTVDGLNDAPIVSGPLPAVTFDDGETITPIATSSTFANPNGAVLNYNATGLPQGLVIDPVTGIISGTVDNSASLGETYAVSIIATAPDGPQFETTLVIQVENVAPIANDDTVATALNTPVTINVIANDQDGAPDSDPLTVSQITLAPTNGTVTINPDGTLNYVPNAAFTGTDTFTYEVSDGEGGTETASVTISVGLPAPDTPTSTTITPANVTDGAAITPIDVSGNFTDPNGDPLTYVSTGLPTGLVIDPNTGQITGTVDPDASQNGPYTAVISAFDPSGNQVSETITINVTNPLPVANDDSADTAINTAVLISPLSNDNDPDGDAFEIILINNQPANGTVVINADGSVTYTPNGAFTGTDTFTYVVEDANGGRDEATITVNVGITDPNTPTAAPIAPQTIAEGAPIVPINVSGNFNDPNGDPLTYSATGLPQGLTIDPSTGVVTGTPANDASASGPYMVSITAVDPAGNQVNIPTLISVTNPAPTANLDTAITAVNAPVTIDVLFNDTDPDGDPLSVTSAGPASNGTVVTNPDGTVTYTPNNGYSGPDSFSYTMVDAQGATSTQTVTIDVSTALTLPMANPAFPQVNASDGATPPAIDTSNFIIDPDGDPLTFSITGLPPGLTISPTTGVISGSVTTNASQGGPNSDGKYTVTITGTDPFGGVVTSTLLYEIENLAPIAKDDAITVDEGDNSTGNLFADNGSGTDGDAAPDNDPIVVSAVASSITGIPATGNPASIGTPVTGSNGGQFVVQPDGTFSFDPGSDFEDLDKGESRNTAVVYQISDGQGGFDTATMTISITGANDAPVVTDPKNPSGIPNEPTIPTDPDNIIPDISGADNQTLTPVDVSSYFVDVDGDPLQFTIDPTGSSAPSWLTIDPVTGIITGTPPSNASQGGANSDGVYQIVIVATDPDGAFVTTTLDFSITNIAPITVGNIPDTAGTEGLTIALPIDGYFNDLDGDVLTYSATGLPTGLTIDPATGLISGAISGSAVGDSPSANGIYTVVITVDDGEGGTISLEFTYTIQPAPISFSSDKFATLPLFSTGNGFGGDNTNNMILSDALNEISPLGEHMGLFNAEHPIMQSINQINPLGPVTSLGDNSLPISDLFDWINESRQVLANSFGIGEDGSGSEHTYIGGDAIGSTGEQQIMARSLVLGQVVFIELFGDDYDPSEWSIQQNGSNTVPGWIQIIDGRAMIMLRPADIDGTTLVLRGPPDENGFSAEIELQIDLATGQLEFVATPPEVTLVPIFSDQIEAMHNASLKQVQSLRLAG